MEKNDGKLWDPDFFLGVQMDYRVLKGGVSKGGGVPGEP